MIFNIYKPKDLTSHDVVAKARGILRTKKVGHAGTLDPLAEGVLIILTDTDTKKQQEFMSMEKEYVAEICFGAVSPTYDLEIIPSFKKNITLEEAETLINRHIPEFIGTIVQTIPPYSAKKVDGKKLYLLARKGLEITDQKKEVTIKSIDILDYCMKEIGTSSGIYSLPHFTVKVKCSSGTFIRSIAHELGLKALSGAILTHLVRTAVGEYRVEDSIKIEDLLSLR